MNAGKWLIVGIFCVSMATGLGAWAHRYYRTDEVQRLWGAEMLDLIANAPRVEVVRESASGEAARRDATRANGMLNVRYMLGSDFSYELPPTPSERSVKLPWKLEFQGGAEKLVLEFSDDATIVSNASTGKSVRLVALAAANLRSFLEEQLPSGSAKEDGN